MAGLISFSVAVKNTTFLRKVHTIQGHFAQGNGRMRLAHQRSVDWLTNQTIRNLEGSATKRAPDTRHARLATVLRDPSISSANASGFKFIIDERMRAADARVAAYYRTIEGGPGSEYGRWWWVRETAGNPFGLFFFGPGGTRGQQGRGSRSVRFPQVHIVTPQPAYHYIQRAIDEFESQKKYREFAIEELRRGRIPVH